MRGVVMVLVGRFRQHWRSWLALSVLVAVVGGFVLAAAGAARRMAAAFPDFVARHGYDVVEYSGQVKAVIAWQTTLTLLIAMAIGGPLGMIGGRLA